MFKVCITTFLILAIMSFNSAASWPGHKTSDVNSYRIYPKNGNFYVSKKQKLIIDTLPAGKKVILDTLLRNVSDTANVSDSLRDVKSNDTLPYRLSKNALVAPVEFSAEDSMVLDIPGRSATVYGKESNLLYKDNDVKAPVIVYDMNTGDISASLVKDSAGKVIERPSYKSGDMTTESDSFRFNMKTGKGLTKGTYTQQGEMYVYGESIKKIDNEVLFAYKGRFTTCNLDTPHFAFAFTKTKFINDKMALTGPIHPEVEGVPIPIYLPFGIYPLAQGRHSGLLAPSFVTNEQRGLGLEGLGYYKVLGEYWDFILQTSIYSYGGWSLSVNPRYSKRYRYNGSFLLNIQHFNFNFKGDPDFGTNRSFNIQWVHSTDAKSRPGVTFSGNVNAGSSSYNSYVPNNPMLNISNMMSSSIRYSKTWKGTPFNLTVAANHQQNTNLKQITLDLPTINFSMSTIYPFRKKERAGESKWYENIGFGYNMDTRSTATFYDTVKTKSIFQQIRDTVRWGARHRIPISLSLPPLGFFQVSPSVSYDETWFQVKSIHYYNPTGDTLLTRLEKGLYTARNMSFGLGASTRIFGMLMAKKKDARIIGIRHEIRPTVTASYQPDFQKRNYYFLTDSLGRKTRYAYYESRYNLNPLYSPGEFGGLTFSIDNNVSMKVRSRKDTGEAAIKKISIIDAFSISGSYNFLQDSFKFQPITMSASSNLFNKVSLTGFASFNLYEVNDSGRPVNRLIWKRKPISLGRLTSASLSLSSSFQGGNKKTGEEPGLKPNGYRPESGYSLDEFNQELAYINAHPGEYADFNIPWSLNFSYSLSLNRQFLMNYGFKSTVSQNLNLGGTVNLTPKWQLGLQTYYNISDGTLNPMTLSLSRDLHCWQMSVSVSSGMYRYFSINISPKAPILRDLRVNKTESFRRL
ncbi:MAG TPA: putative LPS assembly protein LptD [Ginsengibacter sp.]|nr:putative LPS assembly protein LptD [Ginsengibacter sp.]HRP18371.1 putative LPS assembly protein LptD [Ginsengibacter sp.]HRP44628.1 putative LPS assembly protein LptD [Ginsengibacter sp.]